MKQTNSLVVGLLLGTLSLSEAVKLGLPDYWDPFYADTWRYTKDPHLVDADQWIDDAPQAYTTVQLGKQAVPDFYANGYSDTWRHTGKSHIVDADQWVDDAPQAYTAAQKSSKQWDPTVVKNMGKAEDYKVDAPDGYKEHIVWHPPNPKTPEQEKQEERDQIVKEAKVVAKQSEHKVHKASLVQKKHKKHHKKTHDKWPVYQDGQYREHAWTDEQYNNSNEAEWEEETKHPSGYQKSKKSFLQKKTYPAGTHSWIKPYHQRDHAWSDEQHENSDEETWDAETKTPTGYKVTPSFTQKATYPSKDSHSWIEPYSQRDHAWNVEEHDQSDERSWKHESQHPSGYQVTPDSFAQRKTYPSKDSHSWIEPYSQRDHAWNVEEHDQPDERAWKHKPKHPPVYQVNTGDRPKGKESRGTCTYRLQPPH